MVSVIDDRRQRFETLAAEVAPLVLRYALRRTDDQTAQDVVSETLLVAWRRVDDIPPGGEVPWCYGVARHCLENQTRSARRQRRLVARIVAVDPPAETAAAVDPPDPELHAALGRLSDADQELLRLWAWEELAPREIAVVLGLTPNAVSIRLHRARGRLAAALNSRPGQGDRGRKGGAAAGHGAVEDGGAT